MSELAIDTETCSVFIIFWYMRKVCCFCRLLQDVSHSVKSSEVAEKLWVWGPVLENGGATQEARSKTCSLCCSGLWLMTVSVFTLYIFMWIPGKKFILLPVMVNVQLYFFLVHVYVVFFFTKYSFKLNFYFTTAEDIIQGL